MGGPCSGCPRALLPAIKNICKRPFTNSLYGDEINISSKASRECRGDGPLQGLFLIPLKCTGIVWCNHPQSRKSCCCNRQFLALLVFLCSNSESWELSNHHVQKSLGAWGRAFCLWHDIPEFLQSRAGTGSSADLPGSPAVCTADFLSPTALRKSGWLSKSLLKPETCGKDIYVLLFELLGIVASPSRWDPAHCDGE